MAVSASATRRSTPLYIARLAVVALGVLLAGGGCSKCSKGAATKTAGPLTPGASITVPPARAAYVTNNASDTISVFDRDAEGSVVHVPLDLDPDAHEAPHHLAIDAATKRVYVALAFPAPPGRANDPHAAHGNATDVGKLARLDLDTLAVRETEDVDENPGDVVLSADRTHVLVTHFDMRRAMTVAARGGASPATMFAHLAVFDAKTMHKLASRAVCTAPHGVTTTRDGKTAYVACYGADELAIVDLASEGLATSRIPLGSAPGVPGVPRYGPYSATLSPDESRVVVADLEGQDVRVFDPKERRFVADKTVPLAAKAFMPAFVTSDVVLVPTQAPDGLARVDVAQAKVERRVTFPKDDCALPHVVRVARDGRVYLVCEGDHTAAGTVLEIDPVTLTKKKRWTVGAYPDGIAFGDE